MFTRCPACEAVYELGPAELAEAAGVVRCSDCGKTFNSLAQLFESLPEDDAEPIRGQGMPPLLGRRVLEQSVLPGFETAHVHDPSPPEDHPDSGEDESPPWAMPRQPSRAWPALTALLGLLALAQSIWLFDLSGHVLGSSGPAVPAILPGEAFVVVARDLHAHPSIEQAVILSAMLRNESSRTMAFPVIELRLFDRSNQLLGARRLDPADYLDNPARASAGLAPNVLLPVIIELALGGSEPAGFEFRFL